MPTYVCANPRCSNHLRPITTRQCPACFHYATEEESTHRATNARELIEQPIPIQTPPAPRRRRIAEFTEPSRSWARDSIAQLGSAISEMGIAIEHIDFAQEGAALLARVDARYSAVIFAGARENPSRVVLSTGVLQDLDTGLMPVILEASNEWNKTRAQGRCVVTATPDRGTVVTLQETMVPAILTNVPPFFQSFLTGFASEARIARRHLHDFQLSGTDFVINSSPDVDRVLRTIDVETDLLLDTDELV